MRFRDWDLDDQVRAAIRRDGRLSLPLHRIGIHASNGIVRVKGNVSAREREHALDLVRGVEAVATVLDKTSTT